VGGNDQEQVLYLIDADADAAAWFCVVFHAALIGHKSLGPKTFSLLKSN
jgi:hypothetical protein